jgi:Galactokinase
MKITDIKALLNSNQLENCYQKLYVDSALFPEKKERFLCLLQQFSDSFPQEDVFLFSTPGRSEIIGNHTDHQNGKVIAASINLDMIAFVGINENEINIISDGEVIGPIDITDLTVKQEEFNSSMALIRGVVACFKDLGYQYGGFNAVLTSDVLIGSGLSSSAAFEVLIGNILNHCYNQGSVDAITLAKIGQYSENVYFNKPSGLMDQMACAIGDLVYIDFKNNEDPEVMQLLSPLAKHDFNLCVVNTGGSHANLSGEYAAIVTEMKSIASAYDIKLLSDLDYQLFYQEIGKLREEVSDRAIIRAIHFDQEMKRVELLKKAILDQDMQQFQSLIQASGNSSFRFLQNVMLPFDVTKQSISVALAVSENILGTEGVSRVHGGGFAGTIQAFVPHHLVAEYKTAMEQIFGLGSCNVLNIRPVGTCCIINEGGSTNV